LPEKGVEIMELINAMIATGICSLEDAERLTIHMHMSDGLRKREAYSCRYFIHLNEIPLCTIKKIPQNGIYHIDRMIATQNLFRSFKEFTAPEILGTYSGADGYFYLLEEYIDSGISLDQAIMTGVVSIEQANKIYYKLFSEIYCQPELSRHFSSATDEIEEIISVLKYLPGLERYLDDIRELIVKYHIHVDDRSRLTSGDLIPKNIIITKNKPVIVDFDLSKVTKLFFLDIFRTLLYANFRINLNEYHNFIELTHPKLLMLLCKLNEIKLQYRVVNEPQFNSFYKYCYDEILSNLKDLSLDTDAIEKQLKNNEKDSKSIFIAQLYIDLDDGFNEQNSLIAEIEGHESFIQFNTKDFKNIIALRFDPANIPVVLDLLKVEAEFKDQKFECMITNTNADYVHGELYYFLHHDPQVYISTENIPERIEKITIYVNYKSTGFEDVKKELLKLLEAKEKTIEIQTKIIEEKEAIIQEKKLTKLFKVINRYFRK